MIVPARVEFPDGVCLPVPQLEGLCPCLRLSFCVCHRGSDHPARESPLLPGGDWAGAGLGVGQRELLCSNTAVGLV